MRDAQLPGLNEVSSQSTEQDLVRWLDAELRQTYLVNMMPTWFTLDGAVQLLLDLSKLESTVRYLCIEVDDALEISEQTEI